MSKIFTSKFFPKPIQKSSCAEIKFHGNFVSAQCSLFRKGLGGTLLGDQKQFTHKKKLLANKT
ncbi:MAG: hypothetical protein A2007_03035 [Verrucomicrobia bacterium GWC2_42_7]|nr:MAG: hypothetical protein A2007_03035 [Verrucomicrobia bacterium GWC2_42_7]